MSNHNSKPVPDLDKILDDAKQHDRGWNPVNESHDDRHKTNDQIVSNTFKPPLPDGGDGKKKE